MIGAGVVAIRRLEGFLHSQIFRKISKLLLPVIQSEQRRNKIRCNNKYNKFLLKYTLLYLVYHLFYCSLPLARPFASYKIYFTNIQVNTKVAMNKKRRIK